jgi:hypothetical protein
LGSVTAVRGRITRVQLLLAEGELPEARRRIGELLVEMRADQSRRFLLTSVLVWSGRVALAQQRYSDALAFANDALTEATARARDPVRSLDVGETSLLVAQAKAGLKDTMGSQVAARQAVESLTASVGADNSLTRAAQRLLLPEGAAK